MDSQIDKELLQKLFNIIIQKQTLNDNKCGTTVNFLIEQMNIDSNEIKILLNKLHEKKLVRFRSGINHKLIFLRR